MNSLLFEHSLESSYSSLEIFDTQLRILEHTYDYAIVVNEQIILHFVFIESKSIEKDLNIFFGEVMKGGVIVHVSLQKRNSPSNEGLFTPVGTYDQAPDLIFW